MEHVGIDLDRLKTFIINLRGDIYPETETDGHNQITKRMIDHLVQAGHLCKGDKVLDVGCGQGYSLETFTQLEAVPVGVTLGQEDLEVCRKKKLKVFAMDQSFLKFADGIFDVLWCRHCLEHSIFPLFTLSEFNRVLRPGGLLYVEVPAPDTSCAHQKNKNHYSVLGKSMWIELIQRSGFSVIDSRGIELKTHAGPDVYYVFIAKKDSASQKQPVHDETDLNPSEKMAVTTGKDIRTQFGLSRKQIGGIDLTRFSRNIINKEHRNFFFDNEFKEHYRLIAYLSTLFNNATIFDIGTNLGYSAIALSYNPSNTIISYDIRECREIGDPETLKNIEFNIGDVLSDKRLENAELIMLDTNHDGSFENEAYRHFHKIGFKGLLFLDDIHLNRPMELFWNTITETKDDITDLGHWSGSGIVDFSS
ncbi:hypothetical protein DSCO28_03500 [Desulfosarcina ovata subsp. sediminis]|uniref:Methyltransferase type 11 domain-containing protein n=1 Tax=Desulfosarcina ovata subsp. sediminis TaxID=885957 RepID=A0A5K7ZET7_9BACT|nr:class I SAM-dependent methyltransferase [Desulfosarcina ovata]BBO79784.1 hypothetical protein DSCO28_03500 [Desulfosarcina ovata subsp. sediminis]